jgi:hypothetical protein
MRESRRHFCHWVIFSKKKYFSEYLFFPNEKASGDSQILHIESQGLKNVKIYRINLYMTNVVTNVLFGIVNSI